MARTANVEPISKPRRPNICRVLRRANYAKCLVCSLLLVFCFAYATYCHVKHEAYSGNQPLLIYQYGPCAQGYNFVPIVFGLMMYIVYIMECWHSRIKLLHMKKVKFEGALDYIAALKDATPIVWWKSICYHYVRKTRQVTRYRNGDAVPTTQVFYERVNSHNAGNIFIYDFCGFKDISKPITNIEKFSVTRIRLSRNFVFANMQAANEFEEQRSRFFNENEAKDDYMEVREGMDLSNIAFLDEMLCFNRPHPPWFLHPIVFWIASLLLLSWPLRIYTEWKTAILTFHIVKLFGTNYLSPSSANYTGPLTRTSTMDTAELDALLSREQLFIIPSYSEAMLLQNAIPNELQVTPINRRAPLTPLFNMRSEHPILRNYGAVEEGRSSAIQAIRSSQSMSFSQTTTREGTAQPGVQQISRGTAMFRSFSISGMAAWSNGYQQIGGAIAAEEPPPPYEFALRMCVPLYQRVRRSISSRLASISRTNSKEIKYNFAQSGRNCCNNNNDNHIEDNNNDENGNNNA